MTRSTITNSRLEEVFGELRAEDRATAYLTDFPKDIAAVIAVRTAVELASVWQIEDRSRARRDDRRLSYHSVAEDRQVLYLAAVEYSCHPFWWQYSDDTYSELFSSLSPDAAARIAFIVARYMAYWARSS
jgi:hypothetical protein